MTPGPVLSLPTVTLCAASSVNLAATLQALRRCLDLASFADCLLFTDAHVQIDGAAIRVVPIERMRSAADYSRFMLQELVGHVQTEHVLVVQWDGFIVDPGSWNDEFLRYDYIGAPWPQFHDGHDVGNGGFSLRSRRLLEACRSLIFEASVAEDVAICRKHRLRLETEHDISIAPVELARRFAFERSPPIEAAFGFHGVFNMIKVMGLQSFWETYRTLDDKRTVLLDYRSIFQELGTGSRRWLRRIHLAQDLIMQLLRRR